jgi:hypothetical protein
MGPTASQGGFVTSRSYTCAEPSQTDAAVARPGLRWSAVLALAILVLSSCGEVSKTPPVSRIPDTSKWCRTGSSSVPVTFRIPPDLESVLSTYTNSHEWTSTDQRRPIVSLDFAVTRESEEPEPGLGVFRLLPFHTSPKRGYRKWSESIDGRPMQLVTYSRYGRSVAIAKVPLDSAQWVKLIMVGQENLEDVKAILPAIARTLEFGAEFEAPPGTPNARICPSSDAPTQPPTKSAA